MKKSIIVSLLISLTLVLSAQAQTSSSPTSIEDLQKQIQLLLSQMSSLQKEITTLKSSTSNVAVPVAPTTSSIAPPPNISLPFVRPTSPFTSPEIDESEVTGTETEFIPPPILTRSLLRGSRGEDVRQLQEFLAQDPTIYPEGFTSGYYGIGTEAAVKRWQAKNGVPAVGIVGRQTIAKFKTFVATYSPLRPTVPVGPLPFPSYCPVYAYMPTCKEDQSPKDANGCQVCQQKLITDPIKPVICPALATVDSCPAGEERIVTYKSTQCGVYYACKPREISRADNTIATLKKISSIQTDNRFTVNLYDPEGVQKFAIYNSKGAEIHLGYPACKKEWSSPVISADSAEFPLKLLLADCASSQYSTILSTSVVTKPIVEGLTFPYTFANGKVVSSSNEARSYCYANGPSSGQSVAAECETKFGVIYTSVTPVTSDRAVYLSDAFSSCMSRSGFLADAKQIKTWAQSSEPIPWSVLTSASQNTVQACEREYYGQSTVETGSAMCTDGKDNDGDGFIDAADSSCGSTYIVTPPTGQKEQIWNSLGLKSWIKSDADSARITQLKSVCASVPNSSNIWTSNAGNYSSADFGMPDTSKCQRASSCTAGQYFDGAACVTTASTSTGLVENSYGLCSDSIDNDRDGLIDSADSSCAGFTSSTSTYACSDGRDNDSDGLIDYPSDTGCYAKEDTSEDVPTTTTSCSQYGSGWHTMGSDGNCFDTYMTNYRTANGTLYSCTATPTTGCSGTTTTTTGSTCDSSLTALLGTGCHFMYNDSSGKQVFCDNSMTKSAKQGDTATTAGCSSYTTTTTSNWPTDQTSCSSQGYNWCTTTGSSSGWCQSSVCPSSSSTSSATCTSGQYWNGTACVTNTTTTTSTGSCSQYGDGWHTMGSDGNCFDTYMTNYRTANGTLYSCTATPTSGCSSTSTSSTASSCPNSRLTELLGSGCHFMYSTPTGNIYCDGPMTKSAREGDATTTSSCQAPTTTTTTSSTSSTTSCAGTPVSCTNETQCWGASYYWYDGSCHSSPQSTSTTISTSSTSCPSGQYWSGSACVNSTPSASAYNQMRDQLKSMEIILRGLLGR
ncbi:MAG: peptidoglycan-binding protein [bacterium]|nr:peptidoglycan-binding protein [bacterium]